MAFYFKRRASESNSFQPKPERDGRARFGLVRHMRLRRPGLSSLLLARDGPCLYRAGRAGRRRDRGCGHGRGWWRISIATARTSASASTSPPSLPSISSVLFIDITDSSRCSQGSSADRRDRPSPGRSALPSVQHRDWAAPPPSIHPPILPRPMLHGLDWADDRGRWAPRAPAEPSRPTGSPGYDRSPQGRRDELPGCD